jgi:predicted glycosyltransferase
MIRLCICNAFRPIREKQTGYIEREENLSAIIIARRTMTDIVKKGPEGSERKTFRIKTQ